MLRPKADAKIVEILTANEKPMTVDEILKAVSHVFSPWRVKSTLKKRSIGPKAVFSVNDGGCSVKHEAYAIFSNTRLPTDRKTPRL